jgi:hypothetical protein
MEGSDEANNSNKKREANGAESERDWTNFNRAFLQGAISTSIDHAMQHDLAASGIRQDDVDKLRRAYFESLENVIHDISVRSSDKFKKQLSRQGQGNLSSR